MTLANPKDSALSKEKRAANTLAMVVASFIICWVPVTIYYFNRTHENYPNPEDTESFSVYWGLLEILPYLNAAIDPVIYAYRIKDVRESLMRCLRLNRRPSSDLYQSTLCTTIK